MRKVALSSMAVALLAGSSAFAGLATFTPSNPNVDKGTNAVIDMTLSAQQLANFDSADIVINADAPFTFTYSPAFLAGASAFQVYGDPPTNAHPGLPIGLGIKPFDLYVGGGTATAGGLGSSILVGTLTFDTTALTIGSNYQILVSADADSGITNIARQGVTEPVLGTGSFTVVPEPASLGLLALGAIGLIRRRIAG